ncbi:hypothetical protein SS50377_25513 [Spironucleus salmonicida]|uniref:Uncharacterized protein n=1 Tax=Spironucleus salmonicida TaxID=348837 RepID=V6LW70_9EUKA|nr:hypothetical protein SS50377_25513 [Spironucleus salmonicida]|eukprot:EST45059.1 Hypothetical protein SS50377_15080 [Spironucleus salmonicida]
MNIQILVPSQINHPTLHITGNDPKLGDFNYGQSVPLIYSGDGWHLNTKLDTQYLFYKYISYANPPNLVRFCVVQNELALIDEEKTSPDQLAYSEPIDILLTKNYPIEINPLNFIQTKSFCIFVFIPFLPPNVRPCIHCEKMNWTQSIMLQHFGHRFFGVQLDQNIGEFKFCLKDMTDQYEWEGMFNRILRGEPPSWHNMFFNHTKRQKFYYNGVDLSYIGEIEELKEKILGNSAQDFYIIDPFIPDSQVVFKYNYRLKSPTDIQEQLDSIFSNDLVDSVIISSSTYMFLKRYIIQTFRYDLFNTNNPQINQKLLRDLFWNRNKQITQKQQDFMMNFAWNQCQCLQYLMNLKHYLQSMNKLLIIKQKHFTTKDQYLVNFEFDLIKYNATFSHISLSNNFRIFEDHIQAIYEDGQILLDDQFQLNVGE